MANILSVRGLQKQYGSFRLQEVSFAVPQGYIMGFIGPNGAGKTTTLKSILNMINTDGGEVVIMGLTGPAAFGAVKDKIGVVMDQPFYVNEWTLADVEKAVSPFYTHWDEGKFAHLLAEFGLERNKKVKELSRGMKVKLMLAVALSHHAQLLILDEPTSGLDPVARDELMELLLTFVADEGHSVLFSTHITSDLEKVADFITYIREGAIVFTGTKDQLLESFVLVKGGPDELLPAHSPHLIGLRRHATGFEAVARREDLPHLKGLVAEPVTLDEIVIFMNKGGAPA